MEKSYAHNNHNSKEYGKKLFSSGEPITSYGLIVYTIIHSVVYFLLHQRRDTFEYMDVIMGIWKNQNQLPLYFGAMSLDERVRLREYTFRELWDDLFVDKTSKMYKDSYLKAKKKYDYIRHLIPSLLDSTESSINEPPWGFPKGKKNNYKETDIQCAIRETQEETKVLPESLSIVPKHKFSEHFVGSNGKPYITHYFLAKTSKIENVMRIDTPDCIRKDTVSEEASDVKWVTYNEAISLINPKRQHILQEVCKSIPSIVNSLKNV
jgi:ADP-ribose pyrophosphatase YjhB (NUDIX family)